MHARIRDVGDIRLYDIQQLRNVERAPQLAQNLDAALRGVCQGARTYHATKATCVQDAIHLGNIDNRPWTLLDVRLDGVS